VPQSYDTIDIQNLKETAQSAGYKIIERRIHETMATKFRELQSDLDPVATAKCRGFLEAIRVVIGLPEQLETEMRQTARD
jgi:hypothetical protein